MSFFGGTERGESVRAAISTQLLLFSRPTVEDMLRYDPHTTYSSTCTAHMMAELYSCLHDRAGTPVLFRNSPQDLLPIGLAVGRQLAPVLRQFFELGLKTTWYHSGQIIFHEVGESRLCRCAAS